MLLYFAIEGETRPATSNVVEQNFIFVVEWCGVQYNTGVAVTDNRRTGAPKSQALERQQEAEITPIILCYPIKAGYCKPNVVELSKGGPWIYLVQETI